jgi:hypothetical protein
LARELFCLDRSGDAPSVATEAAVETAVVEGATPITEGLGVKDAVDAFMFRFLKLLALV